ncbi:hypothetical protein SAMD00023353_9300100 [Rosellinia necatrix]|uniref:Uncharacterized protein n=1 Tax=Rosellinia necatrix TaxID=77044 RepID=A0A1S8AB49_ROSNE|nr:hypothetical protein SAMD00023353_9300100 [Rosellinia necatrix]
MLITLHLLNIRLRVFHPTPDDSPTAVSAPSPTHVVLQASNMTDATDRQSLHLEASGFPSKCDSGSRSI